MQNQSSYFCNRECEFFPCHEIGDGADFNCLFCFCPLYARDDCGGCYTVLPNGVKDCSRCLLPHQPQNYRYIIHKIGGGSCENTSE